MDSRIIILILIATIFSSCDVQRWCQNRYPPTTSSDTLIITDTVLKPVYVEIKLPADTLVLTDTIYLPTPQKPVETFIHTLESKYAISLCGWELDRLVHDKDTAYSLSNV